MARLLKVAKLKSRYNLLMLEVVKAWIDATLKALRTLHHRGNGAFMAAGETITLAYRMK